MIAETAPPGETVSPLMHSLAVLREPAAADGRRSVGDLVRKSALARSTAAQSRAELLPPLQRTADAMEADLRITGRFARISLT